MSADFEAIVSLCRNAARHELQGASLYIHVHNSEEVDRLAAQASAYRQPEIYVEGVQQHRALSAIAHGTLVELRFDGLTSNQKVFAKSLEDLLRYQQGLFLYKAPPEYYLLSERYAAGDTVVPEAVAAYQRVPKLFEVIRSLSDVVLSDGTPSPSFVVLDGKRMDIVAKYGIDTLKVFPSADSIEALAVELGSPPFIDAKKRLFKKVLVRLLETVPEEQRLAELVKRFDVARQAFAADFDLYSTEFDFEKVRESFEQKRLAFVLQLNSATSDLLGKMLAIPVGQGLIVSQLKDDPSASVGNVALMLGSLVFASFAFLLIVNQHQSLRQIKNEIQLESEAVQRRFPQLYQRIEDMFKVLRRRAALHTWAFPAVVIVLLAATTTYSGYAFMRVPPGKGKVAAEDSRTTTVVPRAAGAMASTPAEKRKVVAPEVASARNGSDDAARPNVVESQPKKVATASLPVPADSAPPKADEPSK